MSIAAPTRTSNSIRESVTEQAKLSYLADAIKFSFGKELKLTMKTNQFVSQSCGDA